MESVKIIECPRDAWQGLPKNIPTEEKVIYLKLLLRVGFQHIDAVSFVSPKYVPQMADSETVLERLAPAEGSGGPMDAQAEIIGIVVNEPGFRRALAAPGVTTIGYPYSLSERFSRQNANMSQAQSRELVEKMQHELKIQNELKEGDRSLVVYISMGFGNPYGESWSPEMVSETLAWLQPLGVKAVSIADTVGKARAENVSDVFRQSRTFAARMEIGVHLHSRRDGAAEKTLAAYEAGCRRFDCALTGLGGCPFAGDELVGNIPTEIVIGTLTQRGVSCGIEPGSLADAMEATQKIRSEYAH